jgi:hypothetical protein
MEPLCLRFEVFTRTSALVVTAEAQIESQALYHKLDTADTVRQPGLVSVAGCCQPFDSAGDAIADSDDCRFGNGGRDRNAAGAIQRYTQSHASSGSHSGPNPDADPCSSKSRTGGRRCC